MLDDETLKALEPFLDEDCADDPAPKKKMSPLAKKLAKERGVKPEELTSAGPRIMAKDIPQMEGHICADGQPRPWPQLACSSLNHPDDALKGYHLNQIPKAKFGSIEKIEEEFLELKDAVSQGAKIMALVELSDMLGAIKGYIKKEYGDKLTFEDLDKMAEITSRAFESGCRQ